MADQAASSRTLKRTAFLGLSGAALAAALPTRALAAAPDEAVVTGPTASTRNVVQPASADVIPLSVQGASGQSADLQRWQDPSGSVLSFLRADGVLQVPALKTVLGNPAMVGATIRGASGQSADLQQWQDSSGTTLASITGAGRLLFGGDANLYRSGAGALQTDGALQAAGLSSVLANPASVALTVKGAPGQTASYQQWQTGDGIPFMSVELLGPSHQGALRYYTHPADGFWRLQAFTHLDTSGAVRNRDHNFGFAYNSPWLSNTDTDGGWVAPDVPDEPRIRFYCESRYNGGFGWHLDAFKDSTDVAGNRPWSMTYNYTTGAAEFAIGYLNSGSGVYIRGQAGNGTLFVRSTPGQSAAFPIFRLERTGSDAFLKVHPTNGSTVVTNNPDVDVTGWGFFGTLRFAACTYGMDMNLTGTTAVALACRVGSASSGSVDPYPRIQIRGDGRHDWGRGGAPLDTALYRGGANWLRTGGGFRGDGGLATMVKAGAPVDADFPTGTATPGLVAVDSSGEKLWVKVNGAWKSLTLT